MYQEIKDHILEGKLKLAFEEITALELSRDQHDELIKIEARYNRLQRQQGQMTAEMRGIESEQLNDRVLKLINWVSDEASEKTEGKGPQEVVTENGEVPVAPTGPRIEKTDDGFSRYLSKSRKPNVPVLIAVGLVLILAVIWSAGLIGGGNDDDNKPGADNGDSSEVEIVDQEEPAEPTKPASTTATIDYEALKKAGVVPVGNEVDAKQLKTNTERIVDAFKKTDEKQSIGFIYVMEGKLIDGSREGNHNMLLMGLVRAMTDYEISKVEADSSMINRTVLEQLKQGKYEGGRIAGIEQDYLIIISARKSKYRVIPRVEYRNVAYRVSDGSLIMNNSSDLKKSDEMKIITDVVAGKFEAWKQENEL